MIVDIDNKEVNVGDDIIFCDNRGVIKGKVRKISDKTIKVEYYNVHHTDTTNLYGTFHHIRLSGDNGRYIYKI